MTSENKRILWFIGILTIIFLGFVCMKVCKMKDENVGRCFVAYQTKNGNSILKVKSVIKDKYMVDITDSNSQQVIHGQFSKSQLVDLKAANCP